MNPDYVPGWLIALIVFFGLTTAAGIFTWQIYYTKSTAILVERTGVYDELIDKRLELDGLKKEVEPLDESLDIRQRMISDLEVRNKQEKDSIEGALTPAISTVHRNVV